MKCIYNFSLEELKEKLISEGFSAYRAKQIFNWIYKKRVKYFSAMTTIAKNRREKLESILCFPEFKTLKKEESRDGTKKFLFQLADQEAIESVLIPQKTRSTLCLSTQVGCKFNCKFCASKIGGFVRNLEVSEIINQYLELSKTSNITNIVFMGVGEPLDNLKNVLKAIKILTEPLGINFPNKRISISTCGLPNKIKELADLNLGIKLSLSLHAAVDEKRTELMPVNKKYPLVDLLDAVKYYRIKQKYPVTFEYILIDNFNTTLKDARELAKLVKAVGAKLNLIPYNPTGEKLKTPGVEKAEAFKKRLREEKVIFTLRKERGFDINAACGQLRSFSLKKQ
jgi:23S rRNA (adenine2503-C2)-methyltransferase